MRVGPLSLRSHVLFLPSLPQQRRHGIFPKKWGRGGGGITTVPALAVSLIAPSPCPAASCLPFSSPCIGISGQRNNRRLVTGEPPTVGIGRLTVGVGGRPLAVGREPSAVGCPPAAVPDRPQPKTQHPGRPVRHARPVRTTRHPKESFGGGEGGGGVTCKLWCGGDRDDVAPTLK